MKKLVCLLFVALLSVGALPADKVRVGNLYYHLHDSYYPTASVTCDDSGEGMAKYWNLTDISIPAQITWNGRTYHVIEIEEGAFSSSSIKTIAIPSSVERIGKENLESCMNLLSINVAANNRSFCSINGILFDDTKTTLLQYPNGRTNTSYTIPNFVRVIGERAFYCQHHLSTVVIPTSVESIGEEAFYSSGLQSITIPDGVEVIGKNCFSVCYSLESVRLPGSLTILEDSVFSFCMELKSVGTISARTSEIGKNVFAGCEQLKAIQVAPNNPNYCSVDGVLFSKDKTILYEYPAGKDGTTYAIPNTVRYIGEGAFAYTSFISVRIPNSVKSIGDFAFRQFMVATDEEGGAMTRLYIGSGLEHIGEGVFSTGGLQSIEVSPDNPNYSSAGGVLFNKNKTKLILYPSGSERESYTIPGTVTTIADGAFLYAVFNTLIIPNSVKTVEGAAFIACRIMSLTIGDNFKGVNAFADCFLTSINVSPANPYLSSANGVMFNKDKTRLILYPSGKQSSSYTIPNSVVEIASGAFSECYNLTSLVIGTNLKRIKQYAFYECGNMRKLTCKAVTPPVWEDDYLGDMDSEIMVYVPQQSVSLYRKAKGWKSFENIRPIPSK